MQILPGFEVRLWQVLEKLRGTMDVSEVKHIVLGLIFLKYISEIAAAYYVWREDLNSSHSIIPLSSYTDRPGFCKSARLDDIRHNDY